MVKLYCKALAEETTLFNSATWTGWVGGTRSCCSGWVGANCGWTELRWVGLFLGVRGLAAFIAVLVFLPLLGGNTALLLDTCTVPLAWGWVLGQVITGSFLTTFSESAILNDKEYQLVRCWRKVGVTVGSFFSSWLQFWLGGKVLLQFNVTTVMDW